MPNLLKNRIDNEFDIIAFDMLLVDEGQPLYNVVTRYYTLDNDKKEVTGCMSMKTNIFVSSAEEAIIVLQEIIDSGFLYHPVSALGFVFDRSNVKIDYINWNTVKSELNLSDEPEEHFEDEFSKASYVTGSDTIH